MQSLKNGQDERALEVLADALNNVEILGAKIYEKNGDDFQGSFVLGKYKVVVTGSGWAVRPA